MTEKLFFNICAGLINLTYKKRRCNFNMCTFLYIKIRAANESEDEAKARSCRRRLFLQRFTFFFFLRSGGFSGAGRGVAFMFFHSELKFC